MITLDDLAAKARMNEWTLTDEEAICVWQLLPERCDRRSEQILTGPKSSKIIEVIHVKGLGSFEINYALRGANE